MGMATAATRSSLPRFQVTWQADVEHPRKYSGWLSLAEAHARVLELKRAKNALELDGDWPESPTILESIDEMHDLGKNMSFFD